MAAGPFREGLFSDWFLTPKEHELKELWRQHERIHQWFKRSPLGAPNALENAVLEILSEMLRESVTEPDRALLLALYAPIEALLEPEFFAPPLIDERAWLTLDLEARVSLRKTLNRWERLSGEWEKPLAQSSKMLARVGMIVLLRAHQATSSPMRGSGQGVTFDARLRDLITKPAETVEHILSEFYGDDFFEPGHFQSIRARLRKNLFLASGLSDTPETPINKLTTPTKAPRDMPSGELVSRYLGGTPLADLLDAPLPVTISDDARFEHTHIIGGTGHGKSQLLLKLIHADLLREDQPGIIVIDSQGDLIQTLLRLSLFDPGDENGLSERLLLIDPNDIAFPPALNLFAVEEERLKGYSAADRERTLNGIVDLYEHFFASLLGAELTQKQGVVFRYLARLMLVIPNATIQTLRALMEDGRPYQPYMEQLDGSARWFFENEFFSTGFAQTKKQILRRLWGVLANPLFERMFSNPENKVDLFAALNDGKIVLINTAKDLLKAEGSSIFGRFFIAQIAQAVIERASIPEPERRPAFLYIDEASEYLDEMIELLLNQARKYRTGLVLAHQNLDQLSPRLRAALLASTSIKFAGGVSARDARALCEDLRTTPEMLTGLKKRRNSTAFACFIKNQIANAIELSVPLGAVNSLPRLDDEAFDQLINANRARVATPLEEVQAKLESSFRSTSKKPPPARQPTPQPPEPTPPKQPAPKPAEQVVMPEAGADPYLEGQGGKEHKYLQHLIRELGQERGFLATVEKPVSDGRSIDVALEHGDTLLAFEVSVSTSADHERGNVEKCLDAGAHHVAVVVSNNRRRTSLERALTDAIGEERMERIAVLTPDALVKYLDERAAQLTASEQTTRGYRVRVRHATSSSETSERQREVINRVIARSLLRKEPGENNS